MGELPKNAASRPSQGFHGVWLLGAVTAAALLLVAAGCGDDDDGGQGTAFVDVVLSEWEIVPETDSVPAGEVTFTTTNAGSHEHELVIVRTDLAPGDLPTLEDGSADEFQFQVIGRVPDVEPGDIQRRMFRLDPGNYALICNLVHADDDHAEVHYALGMFTSFTVE